MSAPCVCGHGKYLHRQGICMARLNPCHCMNFLADDGTEPLGGTPVPDGYAGFYAGKTYRLEN